VSYQFALLAALAFGQAAGQTQPESGIAECRTIDLDSNVEMSDPGASDVSIVFYFKNVSDQACSFREAPEVTGAPEPSQFRELVAPVVVTPASIAKEVVEFHSAAECPTVGWLSTPITFLPGPLHICPPMRVSSFGLMAPGDSGSSNTPAPGSVAPKSLTLSSELDTIFTGSAIRLKLERDDVGSPKDAVGPPTPCPSLFLRFRDKDGDTRVEHLFEMQNYGGCLNSKGEQKSPDGRIVWTFSWGYHPEKDFTLDITQEFDAGQGKVARARSNTIAVRVIDIQTVQRTWGPQMHGLAANLTLDRPSYEIGQAIPLHIATATFADGAGLFWGVRRLPDVTISIRDAAGHLSERKMDSHYWSGDTTPAPYRAGERWIVESSLLGMAPDRVGSYTLWVTWRPLIGLDAGQTQPADFVVVSNPVEFSVVKSH
jgi:hypothetical protein